MRVLVTGANGMLGTALCTILAKDDSEVYPTDINFQEGANEFQYMDIRDKSQIEKIAIKIKPDFIFHLAAETNVDKCELEPEHAYQINAKGTENVASICQKYTCIMVYISTCGVFDGKKQELYTENEPPNPVSVYSKTKFTGELIVKNLLSRYFIFRAGWMMGGSKKDKKFVAKIADLINTEKELKVVNDKIGCPTYTRDFSKAMLEVIKLGKFGLYHLANTGFCSRYELACKIKEYLKRDDVVIKPISSDEFPLPAPRPPSEAVENLNLKLLGLNGLMRPWQDALKDYLAELEFEQVKQVKNES